MPRSKIAQKYFWDVDFETLERKTCNPFMVERILEYGDEEAIKWLKKKCSAAMIREVISSSRRLSPRSRSYWKLVLLHS